MLHLIALETLRKIALGLIVVTVPVFVLGKRSRAFLVGLCSATITSPHVSDSFTVSCGPVFNQLPVSYSPKTYADWPLLDGRNTIQRMAWSNSQQEHDHGVYAAPGDIIEIYIYLHNGGIGDEGCEDADAVRTLIRTKSAPALGEPSLTHRISAAVEAANAPTVTSSSPGKGGDLQVHIQGGIPHSLNLVQGSVKQVFSRDIGASVAPTHLLDPIFDSGIDVGTIFNGPNASCFVIFQLEVSKTK
jgi:hypothetical protein